MTDLFRHSNARTDRAAPTAPAGGAAFGRGRGCGYAVLAVAAATGFATPVLSQQGFSVPSGQKVTLNEVLVDDTPGEPWVRFRFVAPQIARETGTVGYDAATNDMDDLCRTVVLPYLAEYALTPTRVIISLSDRAVPFGASDPDATQFFEAYRPENADCIWEEF